MKELARFVNKLRGMSWTNRFNFQPRLHNENVAEHSFWVAIIAGIIAPQEEREKYIFAALVHDIDEAVTSDLPALVKKHTHGWGDVVKLAEDELFRNVGNVAENDIQVSLKAARHRSESAVVKLADLISALMFARMEIELGNTHFNKIENELLGSIDRTLGKKELDVGVAYRVHGLLDGLNFDLAKGVLPQDDISHL